LFSRVTPGGCYPPLCPVEPGRSSGPRRAETRRATRPSCRPIPLTSVGGGPLHQRRSVAEVCAEVHREIGELVCTRVLEARNPLEAHGGTHEHLARLGGQLCH